MKLMNEDDYLPKRICIRITGVGERQLRNYVAEGRLARRYHTRGGMYDLVCYHAEDVLKIGREKGYTAALEPEEIERIISYNDTYPEKTNGQKDTPYDLKVTQNESMVTQNITLFLAHVQALNDTMVRIEKTLESRGKTTKSKPQTFVTIACIFVWSCAMIYVAIVAL